MTEELLIASLIREINGKVRESWTDLELIEGKEIIVPWSDIDVVKDVIPRFINKGWIIKKKQALIESTGRKMILHIAKPPFD